MGRPGPELLTRLLDEHGAALVPYARQWCHAPEDVVQEAFLQLMREAIAPENPAAWMFRVVRNAAIDAARSQARRSRHETAAARNVEPWFIANHDDPLDAVAATETVASLPLEQRETIVLRLLGGMSLAQIAELTQTSISTAQRRYMAGLTALREKEGSCLTPKNQNE